MVYVEVIELVSCPESGIGMTSGNIEFVNCYPAYEYEKTFHGFFLCIDDFSMYFF